MRKLFSRQLADARHEMFSIFETVDLTLHDAVTAFLTDNKKLAAKAKKRTNEIDARCAQLEAVCYSLIATQSPVASDFRLLQTIIYVNFNLQRMSDKVRRIARAAKRKVKFDIALPPELVELIDREAACVYQVLGTSIAALVTNDLALITQLGERDEAVHQIYEQFFRVFNRSTNEDVAEEDLSDALLDNLRRVIMVSRYLDRVANISIDATYRLTFLLTGQRLSASDIEDATAEDLESLRIPSGEGVILRPEVDAHYVAELPLDEVPPELARLIETSEDIDVDEDEDVEA